MLPARVQPHHWRHSGNPYPMAQSSVQLPPRQPHSPLRAAAPSPNAHALVAQGQVDWNRQSARPPPSWKEHHGHHGLLEESDEEDEVSKKLREAVKAAAVQYGRQAVYKGAELAKSAAIHIYLHAESSAWTVKGVAFVVSLVLFGVSVLSLLNIFHAISHPLNYLLNSYNLAFAVIIVVMEGPSEMDCQCGAWDKLQRILFGWAAFLASRTGRALFYFFVGTLNMFMMPHDWLWTTVYFGLGAALSFVGLLSLMDRYGCTTVCCPGMRSHVRGRLRETDYHADAIANRGSPQSLANSSPQGHGRPKVQEMEQLLDAEMGYGRR